jgi:hypothetical protein
MNKEYLKLILNLFIILDNVDISDDVIDLMNEIRAKLTKDLAEGNIK